jgi:hypothetical protein
LNQSEGNLRAPEFSQKTGFAAAPSASVMNLAIAAYGGAQDTFFNFTISLFSLIVSCFVFPLLTRKSGTPIPKTNSFDGA